MSIITKVFSFFMSLLLTLLGTTGLTVSQRAKALRVVAYIIAENAATLYPVGSYKACTSFESLQFMV